MSTRISRPSQPASLLANDAEPDLPGKGITIFFFVYLTIEYMRPQDSLPILGIIRPALICLVVLAFFSITKLRSEVFTDRSIRLFIAFVCVCWLGIFYATNNFWAFQYSLTMTMHLLAAVIPMCLIVRTEERLWNLLAFWVSVHCYLAIYGLLHGGRGPGSFLADENDLALALNVALPYAYFLRNVSGISRFYRMLLLGATLLFAAGVVATMSRGGFVGLAVTTLLLIYFSKQRIRNLFTVLLFGVIFFALVPSEYKEEVQSINDTEDATRTGRLHQWGVGWDMYLDNPVFGVGTGNYPWRVSEYEIRSANYDPSAALHGGRAAHSMYFTLFPELGSVGTLLFFLILWEIWKKLRGVISPTVGATAIQGDTLTQAAARATLVSLAAFLVTGVFISVLYYPPFWYAIGISYVISYVATKEK